MNSLFISLLLKCLFFSHGSGFIINILSIDESLIFFCDGLGLKETRRKDSEKGRYTLIFLAPPNDKNTEIELTYNWDGDEL